MPHIPVIGKDRIVSWKYAVRIFNCHAEDLIWFFLDSFLKTVTLLAALYVLSLGSMAFSVSSMPLFENLRRETRIVKNSLDFWKMSMFKIVILTQQLQE